MTFTVKEVFYTLQGEGANAGRPAVFCRFAGCNLWSGLERDRATAICQFCDTDFIGTNGSGGGKFRRAEDLAAHVDSFWPKVDGGAKLVVCTGGEPALQYPMLWWSHCMNMALKSPLKPMAPWRSPRVLIGSASVPRPAQIWLFKAAKSSK